MGFTALGVASILMVVAFLLGLHVASTLGLLSLSLMYFFSDRPLWDMLGLIAWNTNTSFVLVAIPLFILMGEILLRSGLSERLYRVLSLWLRPLPGGLMHSNVAACATFAAVSGSSVATAATIGSVALPAFRARGYNERLVLGSLAAGGTLGILIPPSITFIVYGVLMEVSIGKLYIAGVIPGVMLSLLFMSIIFVAALIWPQVAPREPAAPLREQLRAAVHMLPTFALIFLVLGTIYLGVATPTEAAAFGVVGALLLALGARRFTPTLLKAVCISSARTTAMVMLILTGAFILNSVLAILGVPAAISEWVAASGLSPTATMILIVVFYLVLGTFMDGLAMMVTTIPVILPILKALQIDLVWFGVIATLLTEAALISPPEGLNLYVIHGLRQRGAPERKQTIMDVYLGVLPFFLAMIAGLVLIMLFPQIALWLPTTMRGG
ncbi:MAG: TRAP transporter large permease subunit [Candidatus Rokubacteria bacterium]|nr:TRAP transporter large permease subunit [Candidatus Rokubacteria bacterium]